MHWNTVTLSTFQKRILEYLSHASIMKIETGDHNTPQSEKGIEMHCVINYYFQWLLQALLVC